MSNIVRMGLRTLRKVAASPQLDKSGLRGPTQRLIYEGTKLGFKSISTASRGFKLVQGMGAAQRPQRKTATDLFDLRSDDEQTMMMEAMRVFADEQLRPAATQADADGRLAPSLATAFAPTAARRGVELVVGALAIVKAGGAEIIEVDKTPFKTAMKPVYDKFLKDPKLQDMVKRIEAVK